MNTLQNILNEFKIKLSTKKLILKYISFRKKILLYLGIIIFIVLFIIGFLLDNKWFILPSIAVEVTLILYFMKITNQIKAWKYGSTDDYQRMRYNILIDILKRNEIFYDDNKARTKDKIELLISTLNTKVSGNKKALPVWGVVTTILTTILKFGLDVKYSSELIVSLITIVLMLFGLYLMISPLLQEWLNRDRKKQEELRNMLLECMLKNVL